MESPNHQATSSIQSIHELNGENDNGALLPHLETFDKMLKLPVVEAAWHQSQDVYGRVKGKKNIAIYHRSARWIRSSVNLRQSILRRTCAYWTVI